MAVTINGTTGVTTNNSVYTDASGNTGIGTTSPLSQSKLTVASGSLSVTGSDGNFSAGGQRSFIDFALGKARIGGTGGGGTGTSLGLYVGTGSEALVVNSSGDFNSTYGGGNLNQGPMYVCRAWVNFNGTTASPSTIRASGGVTSVTKNGTGDYTVNFSFTMPDANYVWAGSSQQTGSSINTWLCGDPNGTAPTTTAIRFKVAQANFTNVDVTYVDIAVFR